MAPRTRHRTPPPKRAVDSAPTPIDFRRWREMRGGMSIAEIATRENAKVSVVEKSIEKMRSHAARNSQESVEMATRELYLDQMPNAIQVFERALHAKTYEVQEIVNPDTKEKEYITVERDDIPTQLNAVEKLKSLLVGIQPKTPLMTVDARTQINNNPQLGSGALSSESIIRQIRSQPNLALTDGQIRTVAQQTEEEIGIQIKKETAEEIADLAEAEAEYVDEG